MYDIIFICLSKFIHINIKRVQFFYKHIYTYIYISLYKYIYIYIYIYIAYIQTYKYIT